MFSLNETLSLKYQKRARFLLFGTWENIITLKNKKKNNFLGQKPLVTSEYL